jgi:hypothetical protein
MKTNQLQKQSFEANELRKGLKAGTLLVASS